MHYIVEPKKTNTMAGGKETPRQKMIGMMYLVLTALLALNVSKEIIAAFITINDKLDSSGAIIENKSQNNTISFNQKRLALKEKDASLKTINLWQGKSEQLNRLTSSTVSFILQNSNEMIKMAEGKDWIASTNEKGEIEQLKSLFDISNMDNYDIPTNLFIGGNPNKPNAKGNSIRDSIISYRDNVCKLMANYSEGTNEWFFDPLVAEQDIRKALLKVNPKDTSAIKHIYSTLTIPKTIKIKDAGEAKEKPWASAMFDHAPIVAAAALFTALKVDVLNGKSIASDYMLAKVDAPMFNFNKIEPLPFSRSNYVNLGDSLDLNVMIAAYDSTENNIIRYGIDSDTLPEQWTTTKGKIHLNTSNPGYHIVKGQIGVKENNEVKYRNWKYAYTVGKPNGTISLPNLNILYRGYRNEILGGGSGYTTYRLVAVDNVTIRKESGKQIAFPGRGNFSTIKIIGISSNGQENDLGIHKFRVQGTPKPSIKLGSAEENRKVDLSEIKYAPRLNVYYGVGIPLECNYKIVDYKIRIIGLDRDVNEQGSVVTEKVKNYLRSARRGSVVIVETTLINTISNIKSRKNASYTIK
jgi:gliding motility-associated protein GldM